MVYVVTGMAVLSILDHPPQPGDVVHHRGIQIEVTATEGRSVKRRRITRVAEEPGENG